MTDDLAAFLRARLDEDEAYGPRPVEPGEYYNEFEPGEPGYPPRVLREVEAKRAILTDYEDAVERAYDLPEGVHDGRDQDERELDAAVLDTLENVVRRLAAVYSDHPDYQPEWAP